MEDKRLIARLNQFYRHLAGSPTEYNLKPYLKNLTEIKSLWSELELKRDSQLKDCSRRLIKDAQKSKTPDDLLVKAFALVSETVRRVLKIRPFDVQIIGGIVMNQGKLAEMETGEGKTLVAVFPAYLNALSGEGVHVITFNDYLARRDAQWMAPIYEFLGLSVGFVQGAMDLEDRQKAYRADITYLTAKEAGFDFLRDSLCYRPADIVQRSFHFAIVDEADSILIDEARVPLVIASVDEDLGDDALGLASVARGLEKKVDFEFDEYARNFYLTETGLEKVENLLGCDNLYAEENFGLLTRLNCAIHAETLLHRDVDYILKNGKVELVDEFTGRVADKRRWPEGLQAAIEAKENIDILSKGTILNSITLQHFLRFYQKLSGMTATARTAEEEFERFYGLPIVVIPPNRPRIRVDHEDRIFRDCETKTKALIKEIVDVHKTGQPVLVGTRSVKESILLARSLEKQGIGCEVLNAKQDACEAGIVADAGKLGAVTISTNMAGRGTDIQLGGPDENEKQRVTMVGGLYVIGTNKHESQRIDNQLRGRSGRQGDPGSSRFFISMEDDLFVRYRFDELVPQSFLKSEVSDEFDNPVVKREMLRVQRIVEGQNLEIKKTLTEYAHLVEKQRQIIFEMRRCILLNEDTINLFKSHSPDHFARLSSEVENHEIEDACRKIALFQLDKQWAKYLAKIADIREGIHLTRLGGDSPLFVFSKKAVAAFDELMAGLEKEMCYSFNRIEVNNKHLDLAAVGLKVPSATWTYMVNDNPFEFTLGVKCVGDIGLQIAAGHYWFLMLLSPLIKRLFRKRGGKS